MDFRLCASPWKAKLSPETVLNMPKSLQSIIRQPCRGRKGRVTGLWFFFSRDPLHLLLIYEESILLNLKVGLFLCYKKLSLAQFFFFCPLHPVYKNNHAVCFQSKDVGGNALQKLILINLCFSISLLTFP